MDTNFLLYDGDCPACSAYVAIARLRQLYPDLHIISARSEPALVASLRQRGFEINEGMVLSLEGRIYFAADAVHMIATLGRAYHLDGAGRRWASSAPRHGRGRFILG